MLKKSKHFQYLASLLLGSLTLATEHASAITSADTLPKGVRAGAVVYGFSQGIDSNFDENGDRKAISHDLNRSITIDDIAAVEPELLSLKSALNNTSGDEQLGEKIFVANMYSSIRVYESRTVFGLLWGITNRFSAGLIVPVVNRKIEGTFRMDITDNSAAVLQTVGNNVPEVSEGLERFRAANINSETFERSIFIDNGYKVPAGYYSYNSLGEAEIETRLKLLSREQHTLALRNTLRLPTATHKPDITNLLDRPIGEGVWAYRPMIVHSVRIIPDVLSWHSALSGTYRFSRTRRVALPSDPSKPLANLNDPNQIEDVQYTPGSQIDTDAGLMVDVWKGVLSFSASHQYTLRGSDTVVGQRNLDYDRLTRNTDSYQHSMEVSAEFSSIPLFLDQKAEVPGRLTFTWNQPIAGRNTIYAPFGRIDLVLLF